MLTSEIQREKGNPLSREKAHISLDVVARAVIFPSEMRRNKMTSRAVAVASDPVFLKSARYGDCASRTPSRGPMQKSMTTSMEIPIVKLRI